MHEIKDIQQPEGEPLRRWFFDPAMELVIWIDDSGDIVGFQLVYDRPMDPHALTWYEESGYYHHRVDDGECPDTTAFKGIPILIADGRFDFRRVGADFKRKSIEIESQVAAFVYDKIMRFTNI
ncbi:MAG: hypothetical protein P1P89_06810 [Desulfobacterales bacterium]|nr:hypothetical protein [Desulfobacterales bacterium]